MTKTIVLIAAGVLMGAVLATYATMPDLNSMQEKNAITVRW